MYRILFICVHNTARSQMAEEFVRQIGGEEFQVESAGFEPGVLNPLVVEAMAEVGVDISGKKTQSVFDLFKKGRIFDYVVTVCHESEGGQCPIFPGMTHRLHMPFPDPSKLEGSHEEKMIKVREIREQIKGMASDFVDWVMSGGKKSLGAVWEHKDIRKGQ